MPPRSRRAFPRIATTPSDAAFAPCCRTVRRPRRGSGHSSSSTGTPRISTPDRRTRTPRASTASTSSASPGSTSGSAPTTLTTHFQRDALGRIAESVDAARNVTSYEFDGAGARARAHPPRRRPDARRCTTTPGNPTLRTDARGATVGATYDGIGRPLTETLTDAAGQSEGQSPTTTTARRRNSLTTASRAGELTWVEDAAGVEHFRHDERDRLTETIRVTDGKEYRIALDARRRRSPRPGDLSRTDASSTTSTTSAACCAQVPGILNHVDYDQQGLATGRRVRQRRGLDRALRRAGSSGSRWRRCRAARTAPVADVWLRPRRQRRFDHGRRPRVGAARRHAKLHLRQSLSPAHGGRRRWPVVLRLRRRRQLASQVGRRRLHVRRQAAISLATAPEAARYAFDEAGQMTARPGSTQTYDAKGRLASVTLEDGTVVRYRYDYAGAVAIKETDRPARYAIAPCTSTSSPRNETASSSTTSSPAAYGSRASAASRPSMVAAGLTRLPRAAGTGGMLALSLRRPSRIVRRLEPPPASTRSPPWVWSSWSSTRAAQAAAAASVRWRPGFPAPSTTTKTTSRASPSRPTRRLRRHRGRLRPLRRRAANVHRALRLHRQGTRPRHRPLPLRRPRLRPQARPLPLPRPRDPRGPLPRHRRPPAPVRLQLRPQQPHHPHRPRRPPPPHPGRRPRRRPPRRRRLPGQRPPTTASSPAALSARAVAGGAVAGAIAAATAGAGLLVSGATSSMYGGVAQRAIETGSLSKALDPKAIALDGALGAAGSVLAAGAKAVAPKVVGAVKTVVARGTSKARDLGLRFSQKTASPKFSEEGSFAGKTIGGLANDLRAGAIHPSQVPVQYVTIDGTKLVVNTRSALALTRGGVPQSQWKLVDATATHAAHIQERLSRNGLTTQGTDVLRVTRAGGKASNLE